MSYFGNRLTSTSAYNPTMKKITYGKRLKQLRESAELTQEQLAKNAKVDIWTLRKHEQDQRMFDTHFMFAYCKALNVQCSEFDGCVRPKQ